MVDEPQDAYLPDSDLERLQPFDVREQNSKKGMTMLIGGFLFLLVLAFITLKLFSGGTRDRDQTPRIVADNEPYKEVPLDRGGVETPNQDKEIYDVLNGTASEQTVSILPPVEEPMTVPKPVENVTEKPAANVVIKEPEKAAVPIPETKVETPVERPAPKPRPVAAGSSNYVVQVASLRSQADADRLWDKLSGNMDDLISTSYFADVKRVDLDTKGIYYRLRISGLADKNSASSLCSQLKARGQDCIVTTR
jgi:cell division septation protein DedD